MNQHKFRQAVKRHKLQYHDVGFYTIAVYGMFRDTEVKQSAQREEGLITRGFWEGLLEAVIDLDHELGPMVGHIQSAEDVEDADITSRPHVPTLLLALGYRFCGHSETEYYHSNKEG